eukprot:98290_1
MLAFPRSVELRLAQDRCESDPLPEVALLHDRLRTADVAWIAAVPCPDGAGVDPADVRCEEYDVCGGPSPRTLPHRRCALPRPHEHKGGGRATAECAEQEFFLLRGVD